MANLKDEVRRQIQAFNDRNLNQLVDGYADDAELVWPGVGPIKGRQAIAEFWKKQVAAFPDGKVNVKQIITEGDTAVVEYEFTGTNDGPLPLPTGEMPATHKKLTINAIGIGRSEQGKVKSQREYFDAADALAQFGLMPVPAGAPSSADSA